tara:strand:- start:79 stop:444 length:366 start_codon:yes stop_codon:yes gene_type:complete
MKTSSAKAKGRKLQDWVKDRLLNYFWDFCDDEYELEAEITTAVMGENGADVKISTAYEGLFPFSIECKNQEKFHGIYKMIDQAKGHKDLPPLVFIKMNRRKPLVILEADQFFEDYFYEETY